jgi:hypothetical protein
MKGIGRLCGFGFLLSLLAGVPAFSQTGRGRAAGYPSDRSPSQSRGGGRQSGTTTDRSAVEPLASFTGVLRGIGRKTLTLENAAGNTIEFRCTKKTKYYHGSTSLKPSGLQSGDRLSVEAKRALDGSLDAVNVRLEHPKP